MTHRPATVILLLPLLASRAGGQPDTAAPPTALHGFPYVYYTPETNWAAGGTAILTFRQGDDPALKPSSLLLDAYITVKKQFKCSLTPELYFSNDRLLVSGMIGYGRIVDKFWGVGPRTSDSDSTEYIKGEFLFQGRVQVLVLGRLTCGVLLEFDRTWMIDKESNSLLLHNDVTGSAGATSCGAGVSVSWDTRDNIFFPSSGSFHQFEHTVFGPFAGSDFAFQRTTLDLRWFFTPGDGHIIAFQGSGMLVGGTPPFYDISPLGGDAIMRGYYLGRYRDNICLAAQAEYRKIIWRRFGAVAFIGAGDVGPRLSAFRMNDVKPSYGAGLRFVLDAQELVTVRADAGFGEKTNGIYLALKEAF